MRTPDEVRDLLLQAQGLVMDLCTGAVKWPTCAPRSVTTDPDIILGKALHEAQALIDRQELELEEARKLLRRKWPTATPPEALPE